MAKSYIRDGVTRSFIHLFLNKRVHGAASRASKQTTKEASNEVGGKTCILQEADTEHVF